MINMKQKILNVLYILFGLLLINGGLSKLFNYMPVPDNLPEAIINDNKALVEIVWLMPLIAFAEIIAGFLVMFQKTRALGILVIFPVMVGVLLTHIFVDPGNLIIAIVIWAIMIWIIYENREKYLGLLK
jgi:putative oxidoreductase